MALRGRVGYLALSVTAGLCCAVMRVEGPGWFLMLQTILKQLNKQCNSPGDVHSVHELLCHRHANLSPHGRHSVGCACSAAEASLSCVCHCERRDLQAGAELVWTLLHSVHSDGFFDACACVWELLFCILAEYSAENVSRLSGYFDI